MSMPPVADGAMSLFRDDSRIALLAGTGGLSPGRAPGCVVVRLALSCAGLMVAEVRSSSLRFEFPIPIVESVKALLRFELLLSYMPSLRPVLLE